MEALYIIIGIALILGGSYMYIHRKKPTQKKYKTTSKRITQPSKRKEKVSNELKQEMDRLRDDVIRKAR